MSDNGPKKRGAADFTATDPVYAILLTKGAALAKFNADKDGTCPEPKFYRHCDICDIALYSFSAPASFTRFIKDGSLKTICRTCADKNPEKTKKRL